jgi:hypothetical protein
MDGNFMALTKLHSLLAYTMAYLTDIAPLYHLEQRICDEDGNWYIDKVYDSFDEALPLMDDIVARRALSG